MTQQYERLPDGLNPVQAGRFGLWLLGIRSHHRALKRSAIPDREPGCGIAHRFADLIVPWSVERYPGRSRFLADLCGVKTRTADDWFYRPHHIGARHLRFFHRFALERIAAWTAFAEEVGRLADEAEARAAAARGVIRQQAAKRAAQRRSG